MFLLFLLLFKWNLVTTMVIVTGNGLEVKDSPGTDGKWQTDE